MTPAEFIDARTFGLISGGVRVQAAEGRSFLCGCSEPELGWWRLCEYHDGFNDGLSARQKAESVDDLHIEVHPTTNEWDAPAFVCLNDDGTVRSIDRHRAGTVAPPVVFFPHAQVFVDGEMTAFDRSRQPE